jgi:hypothetical protein
MARSHREVNRQVADKFKKNKGNQIAKKGEEFVEETLKNNTFHPAQNNPAQPHNR